MNLLKVFHLKLKVQFLNKNKFKKKNFFSIFFIVKIFVKFKFKFKKKIEKKI